MNIIDSETKCNYSHENPIKCLTKSMESVLCDYCDAYILVTGNLTATPNAAATQVVFKNCASFTDCRTVINDTFVDYSDFVTISMHIYNFIGYSDNYSHSSGSLSNFKRDQIINNAALTNNKNNFPSFKYKANLIDNTANDREK